MKLLYKYLKFKDLIINIGSLQTLIFCLGILVLITACEKNHAPVIIDISYNPSATSAGTVYTIQVEASDEDGDSLQYLWSAEDGEFLTAINIQEVLWKSPVNGSGNSYPISVNVSDGELENSKEINITLTDPVFGSITGFAYYKNCKIPIGGATIGVADKETITDDTGYYQISDLVAGSDTLKASKTDFSPIETIITIPANAVLNLNIELISVPLSTKVAGLVKDQDGKIVTNAQIIVLNPDGSESNLKAVTGSDGIYRIQYIPHGLRQVLIKKDQNDDYKYPEIRKGIDFSEIEERHDFVLQKIPMRGEFLDNRDNQEYPFKTIGDQTWMISNLSYLPEVSPPTELSENSERYYVYGYSGSNTSIAKVQEKYTNYGALYNWKAATKACPEGWHLPSKTEWDKLIAFLDPNAGYKMKTSTGWMNQGNGDNSSGFSALPGGCLQSNSSFFQLGGSAFYFSSSEMTTTMVWGITIHSDSEKAWTYNNSKKGGYSVRCIRD